MDLRLRDRALILTHELVNLIASTTDDPHLTTDPACVRYVASRQGSWLDRHSRGRSCSSCMVARAFGWKSPDSSSTEETDNG